MTSKQIEHYRVLSERRKLLLAAAEANALDKIKDKTGSCTSMLALSFRFIGITDFLLSNDVNSFRSNLKRSAALRLALFQRFSVGEGIDPSYVTMLAYKEIYDGLAAGDFFVARALAEAIGGRPKIEREQDHPFDYAMGYALKAAALEDKDNGVRLRLNEVLRNKENEDFRGYGFIFDGIASSDEKLVSQGIQLVADGHARQAKKGVFKGVVDELLCVWGVGLTNLARSQGIEIKVHSELIPNALLV